MSSEVETSLDPSGENVANHLVERKSHYRAPSETVRDSSTSVGMTKKADASPLGAGN
jgi:hypothetical protein